MRTFKTIIVTAWAFFALVIVLLFTFPAAVVRVLSPLLMSTLMIALLLSTGVYILVRLYLRGMRSGKDGPTAKS